MLAFTGFIYSTRQGSAKTGALCGDRVKERGGSGKHLHLFNGWRINHQIARSRYWDPSCHQYETLCAPWSSVIPVLEPLDWKQVLQHSTGRRCLFQRLPPLLKGTFNIRWWPMADAEEQQRLELLFIPNLRIKPRFFFFVWGDCAAPSPLSWITAGTMLL